MKKIFIVLYLLLPLILTASAENTEENVLSEMTVKITFDNAEVGTSIKQYSDRIIINDFSRSLPGVTDLPAKNVYDNNVELTNPQYQFVWDKLLEKVPVWDLKSKEAIPEGNKLFHAYFKKDGQVNTITVPLEELKSNTSYMSILNLIHGAFAGANEIKNKERYKDFEGAEDALFIFLMNTSLPLTGF